MNEPQNPNTALLNFVAKNCQMGKSSIKQLLPKIEDGEFRRTVESQYREYDEIDDLAVKALARRGSQPEDVGAMAKMSSYLMINAGAMIDNSTAHMAEMMCKGSSNGIIEITKRLSEHHEAEPEARDLAQRLLASEEHNMEELKRYL